MALTTVANRAEHSQAQSGRIDKPRMSFVQYEKLCRADQALSQDAMNEHLAQDVSHTMTL